MFVRFNYVVHSSSLIVVQDSTIQLELCTTLIVVQTSIILTTIYLDILTFRWMLRVVFHYCKNYCRELYLTYILTYM